jgi:hypothetical protein
MSGRARGSASSPPQPIGSQPALHHLDGVLEEDTRQGFAGSGLGQLLDMKGSGPTPEDQALGANLDREVSDPSTCSILDPLNNDLDQSGWRRAH